ncbi:C40 family peptidase [Streptomyces sp. NPDC001255]|uniref:C40 family peptidase n=1 Tax=Streptomyces sp. NPDC001255 TaxID=3364550 RepID=UPI0036BACBB4
MKLALGIVGLILVPPLLLGGGAALFMSAASATTASPQCESTVDTAEVAEAVSKILDGADASGIHVEGLDLPEVQVPAAQTVVATGVSLHVPARGQVVALATAMQESRLRNLAGGDRDSVGLFQQRPSQGWGTPDQLHDPVYASRAFYQALLKVPGWQQLTVTQAAQRVQRSALPDAYARWEPLATALQKAITATLPGTTDSVPREFTPAAANCDANDEVSWGDIPEGQVPKGYTIPASTSPKARTAITWAMQQLGTMYQWGGHCTAPRGPDPMGRCDCSSLVQQAYAHAHVGLARVTQDQVHTGHAVPLGGPFKPGDLLFSRGSATAPEHVAMALGAGLAIEAPRTGRPVRIVPLTSMTVLAARRVA